MIGGTVKVVYKCIVYSCGRIKIFRVLRYEITTQLKVTQRTELGDLYLVCGSFILTLKQLWKEIKDFVYKI